MIAITNCAIQRGGVTATIKTFSRSMVGYVQQNPIKLACNN